METMKLESVLEVRDAYYKAQLHSLDALPQVLIKAMNEVTIYDMINYFKEKGFNCRKLTVQGELSKGKYRIDDSYGNCVIAEASKDKMKMLIALNIL